MKPQFPHTSLCHYTKDAVFYRGDNLVEDLLGKASFLDVFMKQAFNRSPSQGEKRLIDAVLVCLMEHGMTPSAIAARMIYSSSPENIQAGVAAGLEAPPRVAAIGPTDCRPACASSGETDWPYNDGRSSDPP